MNETRNDGLVPKQWVVVCLKFDLLS